MKKKYNSIVSLLALAIFDKKQPFDGGSFNEIS